MKKISLKLYGHRVWYWIAMALIAGGFYFLILTRPQKVTKANFDKIKRGMTLEEVEEILGPGADRSAHPERQGMGFRLLRGIGPPEPRVWKFWDGDEGSIDVE